MLKNGTLKVLDPSPSIRDDPSRSKIGFSAVCLLKYYSMNGLCFNGFFSRESIFPKISQKARVTKNILSNSLKVLGLIYFLQNCGFILQFCPLVYLVCCSRPFCYFLKNRQGCENHLKSRCCN